MNFCIAVSKLFLLEYDHYCGAGQTVQTEDADKIRPNFRTPSLEFPPLWNHPAKNSSQVLGHKLSSVKEAAVGQEIAYILLCPQIQTETRPQKSSKLLRILQFSGRHFSCSIQTL